MVVLALLREAAQDGAPVWIWQLWAFLMPGLTRKEIRRQRAAGLVPRPKEGDRVF